MIGKQVLGTVYDYKLTVPETIAYNVTSKNIFKKNIESILIDDITSVIFWKTETCVRARRRLYVGRCITQVNLYAPGG